MNLPNFFEVTWPDEGFAPQDINKVDLAGQEVWIRPTLESVTYHTGEGSIGPTKNLGGPYPHGEVTYTYKSTTTVEPYISIKYGGQYSVNYGRSWGTIPGTTTVNGPTTTLQVLESRNRLVAP